MVEVLRKWYRDQSTLLVTVLVSLLCACLVGFGATIVGMQSQTGVNTKDISAIKERLPLDYTSLLTYLSDKALIRVHDEKAQELLVDLQKEMAVNNSVLQSLAATIKDYRQEYRNDNPYYPGTVDSRKKGTKGQVVPNVMGPIK